MSTSSQLRPKTLHNQTPEWWVATIQAHGHDDGIAVGAATVRYKIKRALRGSQAP